MPWADLRLRDNAGGSRRGFYRIMQIEPALSEQIMIPSERLYRGLLLPVFVAFVLGLCRIAGATAPADLDKVEGPLGRKLDEDMKKRAESGFSGALLVAKGGNVVIAKGYGLANREKQIPFTSRTVFDIGSLTKQFTGAAIAKLESQGKLSAEDKLGKYFRNVPEDKSQITLFHLLTHSAGLEGDFGGDYEPATREWIVEMALRSKLLFSPGRGHRYANSGFSLLAAVIEQVTGQTYEAYLREQLWLPAAMKNTGYLLPKWDPDTVAHGYKRSTDWGTPLDKNWAEDGPYWNLRGNGGVLSTVGDLYRWHKALLGDQVLSKEAKAKMFSRKVEMGPDADSWYSYGWVLTDSPRRTRVTSHNGSNGVFYSEFIRYVDEDIVYIAASNRSEDASGACLDGIKDTVFQ
jgi:CubicO group peptidase (beta-lactamase class C family)